MLAMDPLGFVTLASRHAHHSPGRPTVGEGKMGERKDKIGGKIIRGYRIGAAGTVFASVARWPSHLILTTRTPMVSVYDIK